MDACEHALQNCRSAWHGFSKNRNVVLSCYLFIGLALGGTYLLVTRPTSVEFTVQNSSSVHTTHECVVVESPANRVCRFHNLLLYQGQLWYSYAGGNLPELPDIVVNWHHDVHLQLRLLDVSDAHDTILLDMASAQVTVIPEAAIVHRQWHLNYYHSMTESLFEVFNLACAYLGVCTLGYKNLTPIFIDKPGLSPWAGIEGDWSQVLPNAAEALHCFFPTPAIWVDAPALHDQMFVIQTAVAGIGPYNRKWPGAFDIADRFHSVYRPVNTTVAHYYRQGLLNCLGVKYVKPQDRQHYSVTILNRSYLSGRHMVNAGAIAAEIKALDGVSECRVVLAEGLSLRKQVQLVSQSHIVIMNHGAAMGNIMFMAPGSVIIMYNWVKVDHIPHTWVTALIEDLALPINFMGLSTEDRRFVSPMKENYIFQPGYPLLSAEEKLDLLETGICPSTVQLNDCTDMKMNYGIDWNLLKPAMTNALQLAFTDAYKNHTTTV